MVVHFVVEKKQELVETAAKWAVAVAAELVDSSVGVVAQLMAAAH